MPLYNSASAAAALKLDPKWLDNFLSHNKIEGVQSSKQGIGRRLSTHAVAIVAVAHALTTEAGIPAAKAAQLAESLTADPTHPVRLSHAVTLALDPSTFDAIAQRLAAAVETMPTPARGRPRRTDGA